MLVQRLFLMQSIVLVFVTPDCYSCILFNMPSCWNIKPTLQFHICSSIRPCLLGCGAYAGTSTAYLTSRLGPWVSNSPVIVALYYPQILAIVVWKDWSAIQISVLSCECPEILRKPSRCSAGRGDHDYLTLLLRSRRDREEKWRV